jgi:hypothetical protein
LRKIEKNNFDWSKPTSTGGGGDSVFQIRWLGIAAVAEIEGERDLRNSSYQGPRPGEPGGEKRTDHHYRSKKAAKSGKVEVDNRSLGVLLERRGVKRSKTLAGLHL